MANLSEFTRESGSQSGKFLTFQLGHEYYAVEISYVTEINKMLSIVPIPGTPDYFKGIVSLRGKIIPVIDMRLKLRKTAEQYNDRTCIIILDIDGIQSGLIVDAVSDVTLIEEDSIEAIPEFRNSSNKGYFQGICKAGDDLVLVLDCKSVLSEDGMLDLAHIMA